jgi:hypothetical protein
VYTSDFGILVRRKITESDSTVFNKNVGDLTILYVIELNIIYKIDIYGKHKTGISS